MRFLATVLTAAVVCAILLVAVAYWIGEQPDAQPRNGLTAATVLGLEDLNSVREAKARGKVNKPALGKLVTMHPSQPQGAAEAVDPQG
jgi:hypothetical protein